MTKTSNTPQLRPGDLGYVGRGNPPEHGKIRKGEVRNPYGRKGRKGQGPEAMPVDFAHAIAEELARPIPSKDGKSYTRVQIAIHGLMKSVNAGDIRGIKLLLDLHDKYPQPKPADDPTPLKTSDQSILAAYNHQLLLSHGIDVDAAPAASAFDGSRSADEPIDAGEDVDHV